MCLCTINTLRVWHFRTIIKCVYKNLHPKVKVNTDIHVYGKNVLKIQFMSVFITVSSQQLDGQLQKQCNIQT